MAKSYFCKKIASSVAAFFKEDPATAIGIVCSIIGAEGYIIIQGAIVGVNTAAYTAGDTLYLSPSTFGV